MGDRLAPWLAVASFGVLAIVALSQPYRMREPDPYAYRASARALQQGAVALDTEAYVALDTELIDEGDGWERTLVDASPVYVDSAPPGGCPQRTASFTGPLFGEPPAMGIAQWVRVDDGRCTSEKSPGYPFLIAAFDSVGLLRLGPLVFVAFGCVGLWMGAGRWLGRWGGALAVGLACSAPAAMIMAHRAWMPSAAAAFLLAGGAGFALWAVLATQSRWLHRAALGSVGFLAVGLAVAVRLTNAAPALVLAVWVLWLAVRRRGGLDWPMLACWASGPVAIGVALVAYNRVVFGQLLASGYGAGGGGPEWDTANIVPNLRVMPLRLAEAMPVWLLAAVGVVVAATMVVTRRPLSQPGDDRSGVGVGNGAVLGLLGAWWLSVWVLYLLFGWTSEAVTSQGHPIITARFYLPAIGAMALLGAWLVVRLPVWVGVAIVGVLLTVGAASASAAMTTGWLFEPVP